MGKISFKQLHNLVANVDYVFEDSYPISFSVTNGDETREFEVGLASIIDNDKYSEIIQDEGQYIAEIDDDCNFTALEMKICDEMSYKEIGESLKKYCGITKDSEIYLDEDASFGGDNGNFMTCELSDEVIEWFEEMLNYDDEDEEIFA